MELLNFNDLLRSHPYPGRGIMLGKSADGAKAVVVYFIMGRSENSRNRIFEATEDGIRTRAFDESKMVDPSLIIYHPVRKVGDTLVVTNGDQTDTATSPTVPTTPPASPAWWRRTVPSACPS